MDDFTPSRKHPQIIVRVYHTHIDAYCVWHCNIYPRPLISKYVAVLQVQVRLLNVEYFDGPKCQMDPFYCSFIFFIQQNKRNG